jgi:MoaA/NifB/PqqE/SkfB family radical SAM enzyme
MKEHLKAIHNDGARDLSMLGRFQEAESALESGLAAGANPDQCREDKVRLYEAWAKNHYESKNFAATANLLQRCLDLNGFQSDKELRARMLILHLYRRLGREDLERRELRALETAFGGSADPYIRNQLLNEREITEKKTILESRPNRLTVRLTNRCNILCVHCTMPTEMPWYVPKKTMDEVEEMATTLSDLQWQGGEPFVINQAYYRGLVERAARNPHLSQNIITNGLLVSEAWADTLVRCRVHTRISIDGSTKEVYEKIRVGGHWEDLITSIERINKERDRQGGWVRLELHMVVMRSNHHQVGSIMDFAKEHRFDIVDLSRIIIGANDPSEDIFEKGASAETWATLEKGRAEAREKAARYGIRFGDALPYPPAAQTAPAEPAPIGEGPRPVKEIDPYYCLSPWKQLIIREDGHLITNWHCQVDGHHMNVGHCEERSLFEGWNSPQMQLFRKRIASRTQAGLCTKYCLSGALFDEWRDHIEWI